jgi:hypothetical protein
MKKIGIVVFVVCVVVGLAFANFFSFGRFSGKLFNVSVGWERAVGSGNVTTEKRDVGNFDSVDVSGVFQVEIVAGKEYSVEVQADDNLLQFVTTSVKGDTLRIGLDKRVSTKNEMIVRITTPNIERLKTSGAAKVTATGIKGDRFSIDSSGASIVSVTGETSELSVDVSGASHIDAEGLKTTIANVDASGASHVNVNVTSQLHAAASGASRIVYTGDPKTVENHQSGAGSVSRK